MRAHYMGSFIEKIHNQFAFNPNSTTARSQLSLSLCLFLFLSRIKGQLALWASIWNMIQTFFLLTSFKMSANDFQHMHRVMHLNFTGDELMVTRRTLTIINQKELIG